MEKNHHTKREEVDSYSMQENAHSGLELELHFMPKFFHENGCGTMAPHIHEFYQIIWFRRGQGTHRIVLEAKRQLQHTSLNIKEIGYTLGFEDPSYFVKFFKREAGMMPSEFRTRHSN